MRNRFTRRLWIYPKFDYRQLRKALQKAGDTVDVDGLPNGMEKYVKKGTVYFYATGSIRTPKMKPNDWLRLEVGFGLDLEVGGSGALVKPYVYSSFYGNRCTENETYSDTDYLKQFPTEDVARKKFNGVIKESLSAARRIADGPVLSTLKQFQLPNN